MAFCYVEEHEIEKYLAPVLEAATFYKRGKKYATIEVNFKSVEIARQLSRKTLRTENIVLFPIYMDKTISRVSIKRIWNC